MADLKRDLDDYLSRNDKSQLKLTMPAILSKPDVGRWFTKSASSDDTSTGLLSETQKDCCPSLVTGLSIASLFTNRMFCYDSTTAVLSSISESCSEDNRILSLHRDGASVFCFGSHVYACTVTKSKKICSSVYNGKFIHNM
ncbi:hypothetical protein Cfor_02006 [Coptotermes formosanus]|jgi:hypothetical protein|uniref:Uncharacterized protein n=1 Tax=Coptotermes formosanus TaxID=36987 RepID=A0A6L2PFC2_COPFO|nr:hypothetical protein Cfor_02006 [Coptotermes formosanus]